MNIPALNTPLTAASPLMPRPPAVDLAASPLVTGETSPATLTVTAQALQPGKETPPSKDELDKAVKDLNDFVGAVNTDLRFSVDEESGKTVVKVIDEATKEVIKQFPSKEALAIAKALDSIKGLLVQQKA